MSRTLLALVLILPCAHADRKEYTAARDALQEAYFDELDANERDSCFAALGTWDNSEVAKPIGLIASRFGAYVDSLETEIGALQKKLDVYLGRGALSDQEVGLRNSTIRKIEKTEKTISRARKSEEKLAGIVGNYKEQKTIEMMLRQWVKHPTWRVRRLLARGCGVWHKSLASPRMTKRFFATLKKLRADEEARVRLSVVRALVLHKRAESFELLTACAKDTDWRVRAAVVKGMETIGTPEAVDLLIAIMKKESGRLKDDINGALKRMTFQKHEFADAWERWWHSVGRQIPKKRSPTANKDKTLKAKDSAAFYGIPTRSDRIVFIIDTSGSMKKEVEEFKRVVITGRKESETPVAGKTRIAVAKNELKRAISNLNPKKKFNIIFFNHATKPWKKEMVAANPSGKKEARKDIEVVTARGATYTLGALREAFKMAGAIAGGSVTTGKRGAAVDTIFLLSDGGPTDNKIEETKPMDPEIILTKVREWNKDTGIVIHTIAVDTEEVGTYFLKQLAAQNGGQFVERRQ